MRMPLDGGAVMKSQAPIVRLTPFIIIFALVILATILVLHLRGITSASMPEENPGGGFVEPRMNLSPFFSHSDSSGQRLRGGESGHNGRTEEDTDIRPRLEETLSRVYADLEKGDFRNAEDHLRTLCVFYPSDPRILALLGNLLYKQQKYAEAEFFFRKRAVITPDDPAVYNDLGAALARQNKIEEAIRNEEKVLELNPAAAFAPFNLSGMYAAAGDTEKAIRYFREAYEKLGERILALTAVSPQLDSLKDNAEFIRILQEAEKKQSEALRAAGKQKGGVGRK